MYPTLPNQERAKNIEILMWGMLVLTLISLGSNIMQYLLLGNFEQGNINLTDANTNDFRQRVIAIVHIGLYITCAVFFIRWFKRAYQNIKILGVNTKYGDSSAISCWFIPFIMLYKPYQIMKEIWEHTQGETIGKDYIENDSIIGWWWTLWLIGNFLGNISFRLALNAESIQDLETLTYINLTCNLLDLVLIPITIIMIKKVSKLEQEMADSFELAVDFKEH